MSCLYGGGCIDGDRGGNEFLGKLQGSSKVGEGGGIRNRKNGENKRGKDDAAERRRTRRELKREGEK